MVVHIPVPIEIGDLVATEYEIFRIVDITPDRRLGHRGPVPGDPGAAARRGTLASHPSASDDLGDTFIDGSDSQCYEPHRLPSGGKGRHHRKEQR